VETPNKPGYADPAFVRGDTHMTATPVEEMSFEQAMAELEKVVGQLEQGQVPLEESITLYERGAQLKARCETKLKEAEEKVARLTLNADGQPTGTAPLDAG
jgi:exodeoxyribonuclease VII small subunit